LIIQGGSQIPVKNYPGFIEVDGRFAIRAGQKNLAFIRVQFAATLRTRKYIRGSRYWLGHIGIIARFQE
jgi:hypothetical protein